MKDQGGLNSKIIALGILVLLSRLPFLFDGYGAEEDSWGLAWHAWSHQTTGIYEESRLPGHPVQEFILGWTWSDSPFLFNLFSAIMGSLAVVFFTASAKRLGIKNDLLAGLVFAMVPVVYINSTCTVDYIWALGFAMASFYFFLGKKYMLAGVFLGLAMGCRITSGALLGVFIFFHAAGFFSVQAWKDLARTFLVTFVVATLLFIPVIKNHGPAFFIYYDQFPYPSPAKLLYKMVPGVWGVMGVLALAVFAMPVLQNIRNVDKRILAGFIAAFILFTVAYFRLPQKSAYMIPLVPFVLLLYFRVLSSKQIRIFSLMMLLAPFLLSVNLTDSVRGADHSSLAVKFRMSGQEIFIDPVSGPIFSEKSKRQNKMAYTDSVIGRIKENKAGSVLICGWWWNEIRVKTIDMDLRNIKLVFYINEKEMKEFEDLGFYMSYLREQEIYNDLYSGINSTKTFASPFETH